MESDRKQLKKVTLKAIIEHDGRVLFLKDDKTGWELPGGRIEFNEDPEETLKRELEEELGFKNVEIGNVFTVWQASSSKEDTDKQYIGIVYECFTSENEVKLSEEHSQYEWVPISKFDDYPALDVYHNTMKKYFTERRTV